MIGGPPLWAAKYQAIPFAERGGDFSGCNCYGLIRLIFARELGITLPAHSVIAATDALRVARAVRSAARSPVWQPVELPQAKDFDVVLLASLNRARGRLHRYRGHVGVMAGPRHLLHVEQGIESECVPLTDPSIVRRLLSVHRYCPSE
jgi:cell wall-associated NlpC family hydrolase